MNQLLFSVNVYIAETCPIGKYSDADTGECEYCAVGFYQNEEGMSSCHECPDDLTTRDVGATSADQCLGQCIKHSP